jgi:hypothetical protein
MILASSLAGITEFHCAIASSSVADNKIAGDLNPGGCAHRRADWTGCLWLPVSGRLPLTSYDNGFTEEQWLDAIDKDDDTIEDAVKRKHARIERRQINNAKRVRQRPRALNLPQLLSRRKRSRKSNTEKRCLEALKEAAVATPKIVHILPLTE